VKPQQSPTEMGMNRTGIATSPVESKKTIEGAQEGTPSSAGDAMTGAAVRAEYIQAAEPVGLMPPPATLKGVAKTGAAMLKGQRPTVLLDKLGERAAFERTGTRLYEALLTKFEAAPRKGNGAAPRLIELQQIHDEELAHFELLKRAIESLGADPTVQTPCADVIAVASSGLLQVVSDPRTTFAQCLGAILTAELTDNDGWTMLIELAEGLGQDKLVEQFRGALLEEQEHLAKVRAWLSAEVRADAEMGSKPS
jgi:hypothetical protein